MHRHFIGGRFVEGAASESIAVINPARGVRISEIPETPAATVQAAIAAAAKAQPAWARRPAIERAGHLRRIAAMIRDRLDAIANVISEEQGKILSLARTATRSNSARHIHQSRDFETMQGFHAGVRHSGIDGADGKHGLYEYTQMHTVYMQGDRERV